MPANFADRLLDAIARKGSPVCVGVDPVHERLPKDLAAGPTAGDAEKAAAIGRFAEAVVDVVAGIVPAVKPQIAFFERHGSAGVAAYERTVARAKAAGLVVIGDLKRNDIGSTAEAYALGNLAGDDRPDAITINGYLGADGIEPFLKVCREGGKGAFVLVRTSNPSAAAVQDFQDASGKRFYEHIAAIVAAMSEAAGLTGAGGYSSLGAVVGATYPAEARRLREIMPRQLFLVPGYGAQGATASDCGAAFREDGTGAIVSASRSIIFAYADRKYAGMDWKKAVASAATEFARDIRAATGL